MKNASTYAKKLNAFYKKVKAKYKAEPEAPMEPVAQLILAMLEWNCTARKAEIAYDKLFAEMIDYNDLRVSHVHELVDIIGVNYPLAEERCSRLRDVLNAVYNREHVTAMNSVKGKGKRDTREYLDTLPGITPYVAAKVALVSFDVHAIPVDEQLADLPREQQVVDEEATLAEIESFLERTFKAGDGPVIHANLRAWVDAGSKRISTLTAADRRKAAAAKKSTRKKTTKKATTKKSTKKKPTKKKTTKRKSTRKKKTSGTVRKKK